MGFAFHEDNVLLIRKLKPAFQNGKLNGVGGKIEVGEMAVEAMVREFREEAGIVTSRYDCEHRITMYGGSDRRDDRWEIFIFSAFLDINKSESLTDEKLEIHSVKTLSSNKDILYNLNWIIPYCLDKNMAVMDFYEKDFYKFPGK